MSVEHPVKTLFIVGKGRSGSTLLDNVLGATDGFASVGELVYLWDWGLARGYRCACGEPVPTCPFWRNVLADAGIEPTAAEGRRLHALQQRVIRWHLAPRLLRQPPTPPRRWRALDEWTDIAGRLYRAIALEAGANVVVDSSKLALHPAALGLVPEVAPYAVQLVRDPRAVARSWARPKAWTDREDQDTMPRYGSLHTALSWTARNAVAEIARRRLTNERSMLLRYEDLSVRPRGSVARVLEMVAERDAVTPFVDDRTVEVAATHMVGGNPGRTGSGRITIGADHTETPDTPDTEGDGRTRPRGSDLALSMLTAPLRRRYGY